MKFSAQSGQAMAGATSLTLPRMKIEPPPYPEYRDAGEVSTHQFRVVFWAHQLPPDGTSPERMGWSELTWDISDAADVHEVIAWAESYLPEFASESPGQAHTYCLYARIPKDFTEPISEDAWLLHIAGANPTISSEWETFPRMHPFGDV